MRRVAVLPVLTGLMMFVAAASAMAQPRVVNGQVQAVTASGALTRAALDDLAAKLGTAWVGYAVPALDSNRQACCWNDGGNACCQGCALEPGRSSSAITARDVPDVARLESTALHVLFRVESGRVDRVRAFSDDCTLDAGGLTIHWIGTVSPAESSTLLGTFLTASSSRNLAGAALAALALHAGPDALDLLVRTARTGETAHLRGQALFWLAQQAGDKAIGAISDAVANDPETAVKRQAVFALSQLPKDDGVPRLIAIARSHSNAVVRKQAMFWLGQSGDPRALDFFREILFKR